MQANQAALPISKCLTRLTAASRLLACCRSHKKLARPGPGTWRAARLGAAKVCWNFTCLVLVAHLRAGVLVLGQRPPERRGHPDKTAAALCRSKARLDHRPRRSPTRLRICFSRPWLSTGAVLCPNTAARDCQALGRGLRLTEQPNL